MRPKVLHVIESFNGQATEQWLFRMLSCLNGVEHKVDWGFYAILGHKGRLDSAIIDRGGKIVYSPVAMANKLQFLSALRCSIIEGGYDILHCHHDVVSAVYLLAAAGLPIKKRIVHVHNTSLGLPTRSRLKNTLLREPMRQMCLRWADNIVGVSDAALDAFLQGGRRKLRRDMVIHCGIDMAPFRRKPQNRAEFLKSLGLPADARVLLFVGRMIEYKNPCFVIEVLAHIAKQNSTVCAVFAGAGPLEDAVRRQARQHSLDDRVRVLGWQEDIAAHMQACDMLIWPGLEEPKEGLGLGVVEAQAAGLPVLMSMSVPKDAIVVPELVSVVPLAAGARAWAEKAIFILGKENTGRDASFAKIESSSFSNENSTANIMALYES